jgi:integrase/recombinase XerD
MLVVETVAKIRRAYFVQGKTIKAILTLEDVEPQTGVLRVRTSKFHKSRLVPLSPTANEALRAYLRQRLAAPFDTDPSAALLCWGRHGRHG